MHVKWRMALTAALAALTMALGLLTACSAHAVTRAVPQDDIFPWIGCCDVYTYTPVLRSESLTSEGDMRIQFSMRIYTNVYPTAFRMGISLMKYRGPFRRAEEVETVIVIKHELPPAGHSRQKRWEFTCQPGRYYIRAIVIGIPRGGNQQVERYFFPWKGFRRHHPNLGHEHEKPLPNHMWRTKCTGHDDTLVG